MAILKDLIVNGLTKFIGNVTANGKITATGGFEGDLTGNASTATSATSATNATNATNVGISTATTTKLYVTGSANGSGNNALKVDTGVYLDTVAGKLTAGSFSGNGSTLTKLNASNISDGTLSADRLATSGVTAGTYGPGANKSGWNYSFNAPDITVDNKGRVTSVTNRTITIPANPVPTHRTLAIQGNGTTAITYNPIGSANQTLNLKQGSNITITKSADNEITVAGTANNYNTNLTAADSTNANIYNLLLSNNTATTAESNVSPRKANNLTYKQSTGELATTQLSINSNLWRYMKSDGFLYTNHKESEISNSFTIDNGGSTFEIGIKRLGYGDNTWKYGYITFDDSHLSLRHSDGDINLTAENCITIRTNNDHLSLIAENNYINLISYGDNAYSQIKVDTAGHLWFKGETEIHFDSPEIRVNATGLLRVNYIAGGIYGYDSYITNFAEVHGKIMDGLVFRYRNSYLTCSTAQTTAAKVITETTGEGVDILGPAQIVKGAKIAIKFTNGSKVANATLNINNTGAKNIWYNGANVTANHVFTAGRVYEFIYNGTQWEVIGDLDTDTFEEITYANLVTKTNNSQLIPGKSYRITDYTTTTSQSDTQSAGNVFDVIVTADDVNKLNENARAIQHSGDTYFNGQKLESWQLKYSLTNDTDRFAWADTTNGKGVIYYMKDEYENECGYDFKNIQFKRYKITATTATNMSDYVNQYWGFKTIYSNTKYPSSCTINSNNTVWRYTFDYSGADYSLNTASSNKAKFCHENSIDTLFGDSSISNNVNSKKRWLNNIIFQNTSNTAKCYGNNFKSRCYNMNFGSGCFNNTFNDECYIHSFGNNCYTNSFGNNCSAITFGNYGYGNNFKNNCDYNIFGTNCSNNSLGNYCFSNKFGNSCSYNKFGNHCYEHQFGNVCSFNNFGNECCCNTFGNNCKGNSFGNYCGNLGTGSTFGDYCCNNIISNGCFKNTLGDYCYKYTNITFSAKTINLGFDGSDTYGFIKTGGKENSNHKIKVSGTIKNYVELNGPALIPVNFIIEFAYKVGTTTYYQTVIKTVDAQSLGDTTFEIYYEDLNNTIDSFTAQGTATFTIGDRTIISEGCYGF